MSAPDAAGRLAENVLHFTRLLRRAGLPVGVGSMLAAVEAAALVGPERRGDLQAALAATLVARSEQRELFGQAFRLFWQARPTAPSELAQLDGPLSRMRRDARSNNRLAEAFGGATHGRPAPADEPLRLDAALTLSEREVLQQRDFESMSSEELAQAKRLVRELKLPLPRVVSRRHRAHPAGARLDLRATLRHSLEHGGEWIELRRRARRVRPRELVVLCDISGSMARYARMLLHFVHGLGEGRPGVHAFVFGTQLTNITRALRQRDVDRALDAVGRTVPDWSGGTRIGACLHAFNQQWSRRVLARGAMVLLISDGLDAGTATDLDAAMRRLRASCACLLWLNPLLRFSGFEPRAAGVRTILPYVDYFLPTHNLASLADLGRVFRGLPDPGVHRVRHKKEATRWK